MNNSIFNIKYLQNNQLQLSGGDKFNGAIDYIILKNNSKYILFFLDNHNLNNYCKVSSKNIESLFEHFIKLNTKFFLEEIIGHDKFINIFNNSFHLNKYLQFYNKYKYNNKQIIPIDIRLIFDNFNESKPFDNLDQLFDLNLICYNIHIKNIKKIFNECKLISKNFLLHYNHLKNKYIEIKNLFSDNNLCNQKDYIDYILLDYPFVNNNINENICTKTEMLMSGLLELYGIAHIELSQAKYNIVYLGASHCLSMFNLLNKYYKYRIIKKLENYDLISMNRFNLNLFDSFKKSCIDFIDL
jgi:hypothetical protein